MGTVDAEAGDPLPASPSSTALALTPLPAGFFLWLLVTDSIDFPQLGRLRGSHPDFVAFAFAEAGFDHGRMHRDVVVFAVDLVRSDNPEGEFVVVLVNQGYPGAKEGRSEERRVGKECR